MLSRFELGGLYIVLCLGTKFNNVHFSSATFSAKINIVGKCGKLMSLSII